MMSSVQVAATREPRVGAAARTVRALAEHRARRARRARDAAELHAPGAWRGHGQACTARAGKVVHAVAAEDARGGHRARRVLVGLVGEDVALLSRLGGDLQLGCVSDRHSSSPRAAREHCQDGARLRQQRGVRWRRARAITTRQYGCSAGLLGVVRCCSALESLPLDPARHAIAARRGCAGAEHGYDE